MCLYQNIIINYLETNPIRVIDVELIMLFSLIHSLSTVITSFFLCLVKSFAFKTHIIKENKKEMRKGTK